MLLRSRRKGFSHCSNVWKFRRETPVLWAHFAFLHWTHLVKLFSVILNKTHFKVRVLGTQWRSLTPQLELSGPFASVSLNKQVSEKGSRSLESRLLELPEPIRAEFNKTRNLSQNSFSIASTKAFFKRDLTAAGCFLRYAIVINLSLDILIPWHKAWKFKPKKCSAQINWICFTSDNGYSFPSRIECVRCFSSLAIDVVSSLYHLYAV